MSGSRRVSGSCELENEKYNRGKGSRLSHTMHQGWVLKPIFQANDLFSAWLNQWPLWVRGTPAPAPRPSPVQLTQICEDILSATSTVFGKMAELDCLSAYNPDRKQSSWWCHQVVLFFYFMDICSNLDVFCWRFCSLRIRQICEQLLFAQSDATAKIL